MKATSLKIHTKLAAGATASGDASTRIHQKLAPPGVAFPMVVFQKAGGDNRYTFGNTKVAVRLVYLVKAIDQSFDSDVAEGIMDDVETDLHDADLSVTGYNTANCRRQRDLPSYSEVVDGKPYQYEGAYYEIELTPSA